MNKHVSNEEVFNKEGKQELIVRSRKKKLLNCRTHNEERRLVEFDTYRTYKRKEGREKID